uniref:Uncharacterized protein n=1 Tax=Anopheles atroparvus TaxID=41427 RepID=A0A182IS43_ANOAO
MRAFVIVFLAALATTCAAHSIPAALFTPYVPVHPLDEGYFPLPKFFHRVETGLVQEHPIVRFPGSLQPHPYAPPSFAHYPSEPQHQPQDFNHEKPYLTFVAPTTTSLVAYVPVQRGTQGPWAVPNVFIKGQGYSTNQYVAPAVMKRLYWNCEIECPGSGAMCMDPRVAMTAIAPGYSARFPDTTGTIGTGAANLDACEKSCQGPSGNE